MYLQDENIKGWHKGLFGKQVQNSALGTIKSKLIAHGAILVDMFAPTTKECYICGNSTTISLDERIFKCNCGYVEDSDVKAAKTILYYGQNGLHLKKIPVERRKLSANSNACGDNVRPASNSRLLSI